MEQEPKPKLTASMVIWQILDHIHRVMHKSKLRRKERSPKMARECENWDCKNKGTIRVTLYDTPWDTYEDRRVARFCSYDCEDEYLYRGADFNYFTCTTCNRLICEQYPRNGWHIQYRRCEDHDSKICLRCYQKKLLKTGHDRWEFGEGRVPGMFFDVGNPEVLDAGYVPVPKWEFRRIVGDKEAMQCCLLGAKMIDEGFHVVVCLESMGIGGSEGYITMMAKPAKKVKKPAKKVEKGETI